MRIGQVASWQLAFAMFGFTVGRPLPVAGPAVAGTVALLALTGVRLHNRWLYQWVWRYVRYRLRDRERYLPREGGARALLHLFAPDATVTAIRLGDADAAVVSRTSGASTVLRPRLVDGDPVLTLPRPGELLPGADEAVTLGVQLVFHGVGGNRRSAQAWIAVQALRTPELYEEDSITQALCHATQRVLRQLAKRNIPTTGLDEARMLTTFASLAHVSGGRSQVREQWRCWCCGPVAQAGFRLVGWSALDDHASRNLLHRLLTASTGAVVTVAVSASTDHGEPGRESAVLRVAASSVDRLEPSIGELSAVAAALNVRLDRMDGEHADAVAASIPLGVAN